MSRTYGQKVQARKQSRDMSLVGSADWPLCHKFWNVVTHVFKTSPFFFNMFFSRFFVFSRSFLVFLPSLFCSRSWVDTSDPYERHVSDERDDWSRSPVYDNWLVWTSTPRRWNIQRDWTHTKRTLSSSVVRNVVLPVILFQYSRCNFAVENLFRTRYLKIQESIRLSWSSPSSQNSLGKKKNTSSVLHYSRIRTSLVTDFLVRRKSDYHQEYLIRSWNVSDVRTESWSLKVTSFFLCKIRRSNCFDSNSFMSQIFRASSQIQNKITNRQKYAVLFSLMIGSVSIWISFLNEKSIVFWLCFWSHYFHLDCSNESNFRDDPPSLKKYFKYNMHTIFRTTSSRRLCLSIPSVSSHNRTSYIYSLVSWIHRTTIVTYVKWLITQMIYVADWIHSYSGTWRIADIHTFRVQEKWSSCLMTTKISEKSSICIDGDSVFQIEMV